MNVSRIEQCRRNMHKRADELGNLLVEAFHYLALFVIGGVVAWAAVLAFQGMLAKGHASVDDILLLFIYLELGAMVGIYFKTSRMPVRFLIYVAITALTRLLIGDIQAHHQPEVGQLLVCAAILVLAAATLIVRYGAHQFPGEELGEVRRKPELQD